MAPRVGRDLSDVDAGGLQRSDVSERLARPWASLRSNRCVRSDAGLTAIPHSALHCPGRKRGAEAEIVASCLFGRVDPRDCDDGAGYRQRPQIDQDHRRQEGDEYVINGSKIFISNGLNADIIIVVCKTDASAGARGMSLIGVEADREGFRDDASPRIDIRYALSRWEDQ